MRERGGELQLVTRAQAGDREALGELLRQHRTRIERVCRRLCRGDESFDDVLQETYLGILRNIGSFRGDSSFLTWVYTVARTYRGRYVRTASRNHARETTAGEVDVATGAEDVESTVAGSELGDAIAAALEELSELDRKVLVLRDIEGRSAAEVAQALCLTVPAVKTRLHRARVATRRQLARVRGEFSPRPLVLAPAA